MAKRNRQEGSGFAGLFDADPPALTSISGKVFVPEKCPHPEDAWMKTFTTWSGESIERLTWTCRLCGAIRGRV
jgi:hypothetical protein